MEIAIVTNGEIKNLELLKRVIQDKYIICADGAAKYLMKINSIPDLLVGDFDSINSNDLQWMKDQGVACKKFPARKNATDTELALEYAMKMKPQSITLLGALGSRQDHSIANIMLLYQMLQNKIQGKIIDENHEIIMIDNEIQIEGEIGDTISILPITPIVYGVTLKGLEYPLIDQDIMMGSSLGISNVFSSSKAIITLKKGILLVIKSRE